MTIPTPAGDLDEIRRALALMVEPGTTVELRIPETKGTGGIVAGYFTDLEKLARAALQWSGRAASAYLTLNPVLDDLLARACNRIETYTKSGFCTKDKEILRRRWWLVDLDPIRPKGISSTDTEHEAALRRAWLCRDWLSEQGAPDPIFADSGNGAHLLYRIDTPNDEASELVIKSALQTLAQRFDDEAVQVDTSTFNASRVSKLYGTAAAKGDSVPHLGRVHRIARILEVPDVLEVFDFGGSCE